MAIKRLFFACTGNICRSPMAERIALQLAEKRGIAIEALSGGTLQLQDYPADPHAIAACDAIALDLRSHRSQGINEVNLSDVDWILVMATEHSLWIRENFPHTDSKILLLGSMIGLVGIPDPYKRSLSDFIRCRDQLTAAIDVFLDRAFSKRSVR